MMRNGFTLIEMLVTLTVILLLVALLTAAIDKAQYEAMFTLCQTQQKAIATAVITYAGEHNRSYPYRPGVLGDPSWSPSVIADIDPNLSTSRGDVGNKGVGDTVRSNFNIFDDRVVLRDRMSINGELNCAMVKKVNLEAVKGETRVQSSQALWYGWRFVTADGKAQNGMFKLGDRIEWEEDGQRYSFPILVSDWTGFNREDNVAISSHPDYYDGILFQQSGQDALVTWWKEDLVTYSYWVSTQTSWPGPIDRVFAFDDGSVQRYSRVHWRANSDPSEAGIQKWQKRDDRTVRVPDRAQDIQTSSTHLPRVD